MIYFGVPDIVKHYSLNAPKPDSIVRHLFEVKLDLQDVRSGYRGSDHMWLQAEPLLSPELSWTSDMVQKVDEACLVEIPAGPEPAWPDWLDFKIVDYLLRHYRPSVFRNRQLKLYSLGYETVEEFVDRCRDELAAERGVETRRLREVFHHRFFEMEQRLARQIQADDVDEASRQERLHRLAAAFASVRDELARWFVREDNQPMSEQTLRWSREVPADLDERLQGVRSDLVARYNEMCESFESRARDVEPYEVTPTRTGIAIVSRSFIWV